ncbi:MAG: hypothetical protein M3Q58_11425 [Bacteroidota bacterium]|nr:hypothetical protein [Bacteroidota bacterium]
MKFYQIILCCFIFSCKTGLNYEYPTEIVNANLQKQYDEAKWILYASNFDRDSLTAANEEHFKHILKCKRRFIECEISLIDLTSYGDSVIMSFSFNLPEETGICKNCIPKRILYFDKVMFFKEKHEIILAGFNIFPKDSMEKLTQRVYNDPLEWAGVFPEEVEELDFVIHLIENENKMHPWLKEEAIKRGVIK